MVKKTNVTELRISTSLTKVFKGGAVETLVRRCEGEEAGNVFLGRVVVTQDCVEDGAGELGWSAQELRVWKKEGGERSDSAIF